MARNSLKNIISMLEEPDESSVENSFLRDLKRTIEMEDKKNRREGSNYYKPSSMNCIRSMYYQRVKAEKDPEDTPYTLIGICNSGSDTHERIQGYVNVMCNNDIDCTYIDVGDYVENNKLPDIEVVGRSGMETKLFHSKLQISFLCDGIVLYNGEYYILELKTEISSKWYTRNGVDQKHYDQATCYSEALGINDVIFVYINRDNLDMKAYMFHVTDKMRKALVKKINTCERYVKKQTPPPKPECDSSQCKKWYCKYQTQCRKDG